MKFAPEQTNYVKFCMCICLGFYIVILNFVTPSRVRYVKSAELAFFIKCKGDEKPIYSVSIQPIRFSCLQKRVQTSGRKKFIPNKKGYVGIGTSYVLRHHIVPSRK